MKPEASELMAKEYLYIAKEHFCRPCEKSKQIPDAMNFKDPFKCGCRCETVQYLLDEARVYLEYAKSH